MKFILHQIGNIFFYRRRVVVVRRPFYNPAHMRPKKSRTSRMRVAVSFGKSVMNAVRRHPFRRVVLNRHRAENRQRVFKPFRCLKTSMRQQTVIAQANAQTDDDPIDEEHRREIRPAKRK